MLTGPSKSNIEVLIVILPDTDFKILGPDRTTWNVVRLSP